MGQIPQNYDDFKKEMMAEKAAETFTLSDGTSITVPWNSPGFDSVKADSKKCQYCGSTRKYADTNNCRNCGAV